MGRLVKSIDPEVVIDDPGMLYFRESGLKDLLFSMIKQSLQDLVDLGRGRKSAYDYREQQISADWLKSADGKNCLSFIMPDVSVDVAVARIYADPQAVLDELARINAHGAGNEADLESQDFGLRGIDLSDLDAGVSDSVCAPS